ncbi:Xylose isomerase [Kluyvera cryocrescens]|uniref:Xylose isomerase n=1 Tax=Kluyvera cryocrescens TaxID=580 RepID=A0A485AJC8_KLUCR|nr:Xylose isomerase [Kluyvera cryocrescens]
MDAKVRRQSTDKYDLFYGHIGAMDTMALSLKVAARMIEGGELDKRVAKRYAGWNGELGQQILKGQMSLQELAKYAEQHQLAPQHQSGPPGAAGRVGKSLPVRQIRREVLQYKQCPGA